MSNGNENEFDPITVPELDPLPTDLLETDLITVTRAGDTFKGTGKQVSNMALRLQFACRVTASASAVSNISGRVQLSVTRPSTGVYEFTNAESRTFNVAVAANRGSIPGRTCQIEGLDSTTLTVRWFNSDGNPANTEFALMGELD